MHIFERCCRAIRYSYFLKHANWLWDSIRPSYEKILAMLSHNLGIERMINGTDRILIPVSLRSLSESYEPRAWKYLMSEVREGNIVADVGAAIGLYTIALANRVGSCGRVFAFEPDPNCLIILKELIELNNVSAQVEVIEMAVGSKDGYVNFSGFGYGSLVKPVFIKDANVARCACLDTIFAYKHLDVLKIDVEGFEEEVLKGAIKLLADNGRSPRFILIEVHPYLWSNVGTSSESIIELITKYKYNILDFKGQFVKKIVSWSWIICRKQLANFRL